MTTTNKPDHCVVDFSQVTRDFSSISTQMSYITEELEDHVKAAVEFLEYPKSDDDIHTASIAMYDYDPDDESTDNMDNEMRRRIRTSVVKGISDIIDEYQLRDSQGKLVYSQFDIVPMNRTLVFKK